MEAAAVTRRSPDPAMPNPGIAWPTVALAVAGSAIWLTAAVLALTGSLTAWATIPLAATGGFVMFTVGHDAAHHAAARNSALNTAIGRFAVLFVAPYIGYASFRFIHMQHHLHTNGDPEVDPDHWTSEGPAWQLPFRWATIDLAYAFFYARKLSQRPRREKIETAIAATGFTTLVVAAILGGWFGAVALVFLIPQRLTLFALAWWFDWLPHHGLEHTAAEDRYKATRNRIGHEWLLSPLLLNQNYHLFHHLHPTIPFYRYVQAWRANEERYLEHDPALTTVTGRELTSDEYRALRGL